MNAQDADHGYILVETKTAYSRRNIKRSRLALGSLRHRCVRQQHECDVLGNVWNTATDMVIPNQIGGVMIAHNFSKRSCKRLAARPELPSEASFHELRHTAATLLLSRGVSVKVVSEILGRADSSVTLCIAVHVVPDIQLVAADVIDSMFASKGQNLEQSTQIGVGFGGVGFGVKVCKKKKAQPRYAQDWAVVEMGESRTPRPNK